MLYSPAVQAWAARSKSVEVGGVKTRVWDQGQGEAVLCIHGVPASAYLYRKVLPELAKHGLRGLAFDLPGLGLADRPDDFDYSWTGLSGFIEKLIEQLGLNRFHLVLHDIGGPIGFDLLGRNAKRISTLTVLNTMIYVSSFRPPHGMGFFRMRNVGELLMLALRPNLFAAALNATGVEAKLSPVDSVAYAQLLKGNDGGKSFLKIMRSFELTPAFEKRIMAGIHSYTGPRQIVWGRHDTALRAATFGEMAKKALSCDSLQLVPGKHFLQEDSYAQIAAAVARQAAAAAAA